MRTTMITLALLSIAAPAATYQWDDGSANAAAAPGNGNTGVFMNRFQVQPGMERITSISIGWSWASTPAAQPQQAFLWTDPNNDGNPADAVVARNVTTQVFGVGLSGVLSTYAISPLTLAAGNYFYVGAASHTPAAAPFLFTAFLDSSTSGNSFFFNFIGDHVSDFNLAAPFSSGVYPNATFMYRADAESDTPEPSTIALIGSALLLVTCFRRRPNS